MALPSLSEEIIFEEILPRLPVKSLLKFRIVAKSWRSLIDSKRFMKNHLKNSIKSSSFAHHRIFLQFFEEFRLLSLPSLFDNPLTDQVTYNDDLGISVRRDKIDLVGCCNGLVCILYKFVNLIVWNPTTKKFKKLPDLCNQMQVQNSLCFRFVKYGFGFDELNDDYMVVVVVEVFVGVNAACRWLHIAYSLRKDTWKEIEERDIVSPFDPRSKSMGVYVSGKLHWCLIKGYIESFDLNSHVYGVVELPRYTEGLLNSLGMVGGCLSANIFHPNGVLVVYVMKDYGVKESWDKVVNIPLYNVPHNIPTHLAIRSTGEVLLIYHLKGIIQIYNPKRNVFRGPKITGLELPFISCSGTYVESLASVAPDDDEAICMSVIGRI